MIHDNATAASAVSSLRSRRRRHLVVHGHVTRDVTSAGVGRGLGRSVETLDYE